MKQAYIYLLVDPRDNKEKYLGCTNNLRIRLYQHLTEAKFKREERAKAKHKWLKELIAEGLKPLMQVIAVVPDTIIDKTYWEGFYGEIYKPENLLNNQPFYKNPIGKRERVKIGNWGGYRKKKMSIH